MGGQKKVLCPETAHGIPWVGISIFPSFTEEKTIGLYFGRRLRSSPTPPLCGDPALTCPAGSAGSSHGYLCLCVLDVTDLRSRERSHSLGCSLQSHPTHPGEWSQAVRGLGPGFLLDLCCGSQPVAEPEAWGKQ